MSKAEQVAAILNEKGYNATVNVMSKNGVERTGISIGNGNVRPTLYPNFDYTNDVDLIAEETIKQYMRIKDDTPDFSDFINNFTDFDSMKENIIPSVVNKVADNIVSRDFLDLKVMYRAMLANGDASVAITKDHINMWNVTEDELFDIAKDNIKDKFIDVNIGEAIGIPVPENFMRVISTESKRHGASALLFPEIFEKYGSDARILPSSIHEVIVVVADEARGAETQMMVDMITTVNRTQLDPEDVLSDHPYQYLDGEIKEVV